MSNPFIYILRLFQWPFVRVFGFQEPASVLFSLFNLAAQVWNLKLFVKSVPYDAPMQKAWLTYFIVSKEK